MAAVTATTRPINGLPTARSFSRRRPVLRAMPLSKPTVSVVIVNYCQWRNTAALARSLRRSTCIAERDAEIIIVDNDSPAHPLQAKLRRARRLTFKQFDDNRGFAQAVNAARGVAMGDWVLLLNPDVSIAPDFLDRVEAFAFQQSRLDPTVGIVGLHIRNSDGTTQPSCGMVPTLGSTLKGLLLPRARRKCNVEGDAANGVEWATGCALLIRRDCFDAIGGFDERFFLYYEDVDLCRRAADAGWKVRFEPTLDVTHHTPLHARDVPPPLRMMTRHALLSFAMKYWPRWQAQLLGRIMKLETGVRRLSAFVRGRANGVHAETSRLLDDLLAGRDADARERIARAASLLREAARAQDRA